MVPRHKATQSNDQVKRPQSEFYWKAKKQFLPKRENTECEEVGIQQAQSSHEVMRETGKQCVHCEMTKKKLAESIPSAILVEG